jgi:prevent-host-death family protein
VSVKVTLRELQEQLPDLLQRAVETREECVVQRNGKDYAVVVGAREWKRRAVGSYFESLGPAFRLNQEQQDRVEELLAARGERRLSRAESRELESLLRECDKVMQKRTDALDALS